jgi:lysozyme
MEYSQSGLHLTEQFEGCRLNAYQDQGGRWTIGYGHANGVTPGMVCTLDQAEAWLLQDVQNAVNHVNSLVSVQLTQSIFDSLVDFSFNVGCEAFKNSTMLRLINEGQFWDAADQFERWDHCSGQVVAGLLRRREAEKDEFKTGLS